MCRKVSNVTLDAMDSCGEYTDLHSNLQRIVTETDPAIHYRLRLRWKNYVGIADQATQYLGFYIHILMFSCHVFVYCYFRPLILILIFCY